MIIPGILEQTFEELKKKIEIVDGMAESIQIDVADNKQVEGISFLEIERLGKVKHETPLEIHFMVERPLDYLPLEEGRIDGVIKVCTQVLDTKDFRDTFVNIKRLGYLTGVSLNPEEPLSLIEPLIDYMDYIQFMGVIPGKQGNPLIPQVLEKIKEFKYKHPGILTQIDGGVNDTTLPQILDSGVDNIVVGSAIFNSEDPKEKLLELQRTAHGRINNT